MITGFSVMFNASSYSGDEADGVIHVAVIHVVVATGESPVPNNVTITPSELANVSARELFDYLNETIVITFNLGETEKLYWLLLTQTVQEKNLKNSTSPYHWILLQWILRLP